MQRTLHIFKIWFLGILTSLPIYTHAQNNSEMTPIPIPSYDQANGLQIMQLGYWFPVQTAAQSPAIILLHGCGGPYESRSTRLSSRMRDYTALLNAEGFHVLVTDSLTTRGERELCTQRIGSRKITQTQRRRDALGALNWLSQQPEVDSQQIGLLGWSHGGSNVLAATNLKHPEVVQAGLKPRFAIAFYPGCSDDLKRGYHPSAPVLILMGAADDWTPPNPCLALVGQATEPRPLIELYPNAYHGFDSTTPVQVRLDVPNGVRPGFGVHVGGNPEARTAARARLIQFIRQQIQ